MRRRIVWIRIAFYTVAIAAAAALAAASWGMIHIDAGPVVGFLFDHWILSLLAWLALECLAQWIDKRSAKNRN